MTAKQRRRIELLTWVREQYSSLTAKEMVEALSCEGLRDDETPYRFRKALTEFRHLRTDARLAACRAFLSG